jgi:hypothetical protein
MQQENKLLQDIRDDVKEIKEQLAAIAISLEKKSRRTSDDTKNATNVEKNEHRITISHREARRFAREWYEARLQKFNNKRKERDFSKGSLKRFSPCYVNTQRDSEDGWSESSDNESCDGRHSDQAHEGATVDEK